MAINSLYQLVSMAKSKSPQMASASTFLNMPDLFNFWFSGLKDSEFDPIDAALWKQAYERYTKLRHN